MARLRYNGLSTTLGASLTSSATAVTFAAALTHSGGTNVPTIAGSNYIPLTILDSAGKASEIVYLTAYTAGATTGTITRGQESTTGVSHASGDKVVHGPTVLDVAAVASAAEATAGGRLGLNLTKQGIVLAKGAAGAWDADIVESPNVSYDPKSGRWVMLYVGYGTTSGAQRAGIGLAYSTDGITWTKQGSAAILPHSGTSGAVDENGCSGPTLYWDNDNARYVLYYIGLTATGYEAGTKSICYATATSLTGTWTRQGAVITPSGSGWRQLAVWHRSIVKRGATYYMFFNASNASSVESIGYATAPSMTGPWTVDDTNSPVLSAGTGWEASMVGDPCVRRIGDMWVMDYYGVAAGTSAASDGVAVTPDSSFPLGWTKYVGNPILAPSASYDAKFAHKPFVVERGGVLYHYYTAVSTSDIRQIALATEGRVIGVPNGGTTGQVLTRAADGSSYWADPPTSGGSGGVGSMVDFARAKRTSGDITAFNPGGSWGNVDTALDLTITAGVGDVIEPYLALTATGGGVNYWGVFDFHTIVAGNAVNSVAQDAAATATTGSFPAWSCSAISGTSGFTFTGSKLYTLQAGDISAGTVTLRLRARTGNSLTLRASGDPALYVSVKNFGPQL